MISTVGSAPADFLIITDYPTSKEFLEHQILAGPAGPELQRMLKDAKIEFSQCFVTCFVDRIPPQEDLEVWLPTKKKNIHDGLIPLHDKLVDGVIIEAWERLEKLITFVNPKVIIPMGQLALWALTQKSGLKTYRGSVLHYKESYVVATYSPTMIFQMWSNRVIAVQDLKRAKGLWLGQGTKPPKYRFILEPTLQQVVDCFNLLTYELLKQGPTLLSVDIETRSGHITCLGIAWSKQDAICIPFVRAERGSYPYWLENDEAYIIYRLWKILTHPNCRVITQNGNYDFAYIYKHWHFIPRHYQDTMVSSHCLAPYEKVETLRGPVEIKDLIGKTPWIWGFVEGQPKIVKVKEVRKTRINTQLVRIHYWKRGPVGQGLIFKTLDVTPDHLILTKQGWVKAEELKSNDSLEPVNLAIHINGRRQKEKNCRVLKVEFLAELSDTYCLEVSEGESFVTNGIVVHNCCFPTMQKGLDFLASMHCEFYQQWKGEMRGQFKLEEKDDA